MPFEFNLYSGLLLPAFIQGLIFAGLFLKKYSEEKGMHHLLMTMLLLLLDVRLGFWMLGFAGWYDTHDIYTSFMFYFPFNTLIFIGPCLYFYFQSLINRDFRFTRKEWPHAILPALMMLLIVGKGFADFLLYYPFPVTESFQYGTRGPLAEVDKTPLVNFIAYGSLIYYLALTMSVYRRYVVYTREHFSTTEVIRFRWLYNLLLVCGVGAIVLTLFFVFNFFYPKISYEVNWYPYFLIGIMIYYISIHGYYLDERLIKKLHFEKVSDIQDERTQSKKELPELEIWKEKMRERMQKEKDYLNPDLSLTDLAKSMETNTSHLSRIINEGFRKNFNDYINELRVDEVVAKINSGLHQRQTLLAIANDCGFNSKATFNRSFKKFKGLSPKEFIGHIAGAENSSIL